MKLKLDRSEEIKFFYQEVQKEITETRFAHSIRVSELAENLSKLHGYPKPKNAYLAGILHDITKQKKNEFHIELFKKNSFDYTDLPEEAYHPFSAVFYLKEKYNFHDEEVLSAVRNHTLGGSHTNLLDRILYVSDFLGSEFASRQKELPNWIAETEKDLNYGILLKSITVIKDLMDRKQKIHPYNLESFNLALDKN
ncbi:MAG: bis(5'-nucleosyl)-tetraphosphatase (symmetrical) YqeK [Leptospiraceae bacterium]|nr:bis(5'-nucleosyl)-tetraphosphatase (symmetrical) YqeK [Leptospiraceae bacterium]